MTQHLEIALTSEAVAHIKKQLCSRGKGLGLKIGTKTTGCSGLAYTIEYLDMEDSALLELQSEGFVIGADSKTGAILRGATLDYVRSGMNAGLTFTNPNEKDRCGCGESFRVKL